MRDVLWERIIRHIAGAECISTSLIKRRTVGLSQYHAKLPLAFRPRARRGGACTTRSQRLRKQQRTSPGRNSEKLPTVHRIPRHCAKKCLHKKKHPSAISRRAFVQCQWARLDLNQHALAGTRPSTLRVCQFRHEPGFSRPRGKLAANMQVYRLDGGDSSCVARRPFATGPPASCLEWLSCVKDVYFLI